MKPKFRFTVFTPTFNRSEKLKRAFSSIQAQTFSDFEWLVVDDGSTDSTAQVVKELRANATFPVNYIRQDNSGKHIAINRAVAEAQGQLLIILDDDDEMKPNALERFSALWNELEDKALYDEFCCVTALCEDQNGKLVGDPYPEDHFVSNHITLAALYKITGEKFGCQRVDVMREFPFPDLRLGTHLPESIVWLPMTKKYKTLFVNEVLRVYYLDDASIASGTSRPWKNAKLHKLGNTLILNDYLDHVGKNPMYYLKLAAATARYNFHLNEGPLTQLRSVRPLISKFLMLAGMPIGYLFYRRDMAREQAGIV